MLGYSQGRRAGESRLARPLDASPRHHSAGSMAENLGSGLKLAGSWLPTIRQAAIEKFISCRSVVPHGDRMDGSESGGVEDEKLAIRRLKNHVVGVFVLRYRF